MKSKAFVSFSSARPQRGSALIIVLGILAVMLIMGIAFSLFMRGERGGTTNLKNSLVAKQALESAVGRAMEAIDHSFETVKYDGGGFFPNCPVPVWPQPFLASSRAEEYQSTILGATEQSPAFILTKEIADSLSPSQLALVKSAKAEWIPLNSDVCTTSENNPGSSTVGRYAFIALDTTGLVDVNSIGAGTAADRLAGNGSDPETLQLPAKTDTGSDPIPFILKSPDSFATKRDALGEVISFFDLRGMGTTMFDLEPAALDSSQDKPSDPTLPADLFGFFPLSLEDLDPEGSPKVMLPNADELRNSTTIKALTARSFNAMERIFALSRQDNDDNDSADDLAFFSRDAGGGIRLSRARLATVALLDSLDEDNVPGRNTAASFNYWVNVGGKEFDETVAGKSVKDTPSQALKDICSNPLNFPCTEAVPMPSHGWAHAYFDGTPVFSYNSASPGESTLTLHGNLEFGGYAFNQNWVTNDTGRSRNYSLSVDFEVCKTTPGSSGSDVENAFNFSAAQGSATWSGFFVSGTLEDDRPSYDDKDLKKRMLAATSFGEHSFTVVCKPFQVDDNRTGGGGRSAPPPPSSDVPSPPSARGGGDDGGTTGGDDGGTTGGRGGDDGGTTGGRGGDDDGGRGGDDDGGRGGDDDGGRGGDDDPGSGGGGDDPGGGGTTGPGGNVKLHFCSSKASQPYVPVRMMFKVTDSSGTVVAQAPAPYLASQGKDFWVTMEMELPVLTNTVTIPYTEDGRAGTPSVSKDANIDKTTRCGWAYSTCPAFSFDTSSIRITDASGSSPARMSLSSDPKNNGYWINDVFVRGRGGSGDAGGGGRGGRGGDVAMGLYPDVLSDFDNVNDYGNEDIYAQVATLGSRSGVFLNPFQHDFMFNSKYPDFYLSYVSPATAPCRAVPDAMHAVNSNPEFTDTFGCDLSPIDNLDVLTHVADGPFATPADLGRVMCGPYETLSLFQTYREGGSKSDFHRVFDYFTTSRDRWPTEVKTEEEWASDSRLDSDPNKYQRYPGIHMGRVNLNSPLMLERTSGKNVPLRVRKTGEKNIYPIIAALKGAAVITTRDAGETRKPLTGPQAGEIAAALAGSTQTRAVNTVAGADCSRSVVQGISGIGSADQDDKYNYGLEGIVKTLGANTDTDRESLLRSCEGALTTRGQSYLVIIRADAYTPKFGMGDDPEGGTTLATTHAILELFRDPEPSRLADGTLPLDADGNPVYYHNWLIRSYRVF